MIEADLKNLITLIPGAGKLQSIRIPVFNNRANIAFVKFEATADQTALQFAWTFKKALDAMNPKPLSTGAGKPLWSKPNIPQEDRPAARVINRAKKFLHALREEAGLPAQVEEFGYMTNWMEANYKPDHMQISIGGTKVAGFHLGDETKAALGFTEWVDETLTATFAMRLDSFSLVAFKEKWALFIASSSES